MEVHYKEVDNYHYDPTNPIGRGSYGTVYLAFVDSDKTKKAALKLIPLSMLSEEENALNLVLREIDVLSQLKGEHVVTLLDVKRTVNNLYIFMDYCDGGDLEKMLKEKHPFTEEESCLIIKQIASVFTSLDAVHAVNARGQKNTVMHRDIKPSNIMFCQGKVKLADFGFAKVIDDADKEIRMEHTPLGTPCYTSPQILNDEEYSIKCDVWSTGILFYELIFGVQPWTGYSPYEVYKSIISKPLAFPKAIKPETEELLKSMLKIDEAERISWEDVYSHPALNV